MTSKCYKIFLRLLKENGKYELFKKSISSQEVLILSQKNSEGFIFFLNTIVIENKENGNKYASEFWYSLLDLVYYYRVIINEYYKLIAKEFIKSQPLLYYKINYELYKSKWHEDKTIEEYIEKSNNVRSLIAELFDWAETEDGIEFWYDIDERLSKYIVDRL